MDQEKIFERFTKERMMLSEVNPKIMWSHWWIQGVAVGALVPLPRDPILSLFTEVSTENRPHRTNGSPTGNTTFQMMQASGMTSSRDHKRPACASFLVRWLQDITLSTHNNPSDVLLLKVASHSHYYRVYLCYCLFFIKSYLVADAKLHIY